jgi:hypothetical protein
MFPLQTIDQITRIKKGDTLTLHNEKPDKEQYGAIYDEVGYIDTSFTVIEVAKPNEDKPQSFVFSLRLSHPEPKRVRPLEATISGEQLLDRCWYWAPLLH